MIINGIVLTLTSCGAPSADLLAALQSRREITVGTQRGQSLSAVMEADDDAACREVHRWLESLPGVAFVDVVFVGFSEPESELSDAFDDASEAHPTILTPATLA